MPGRCPPVQNRRCSGAAEAGVGRVVIAVYGQKPRMQQHLPSAVGRHVPVPGAEGQHIFSEFEPMAL
jgi:hypothetical protein